MSNLYGDAKSQLYKWVMNKLTDEDMWVALGTGLLKIIAITICSIILVKLGNHMIKKAFDLRIHAPAKMTQQRERRYETILKLLQSVITYVVYFTAILAILSVMQVKVAGLLAGAGIVGLAVGFGAQSLVKDVITGFFIIFEDQFGVGDFIKVAGVQGTVIEIGLRTTKIRGIEGEINIIPNGSILEVVNCSVNNSVAIVDISVAYNADINKAERLIEEYLDGLVERYEDVVTRPNLLGVQNVNGAEITLRMSVETLPMRHFATANLIRKDIKEIFDENHIEIPYPKMMVYERDTTKNKEGEK